jgi:hypothetical protein
METKNTGPSGSADNTQTIARNSFWYGIELVFSLVVTFLTSMAVARIVGKDFAGQARLGYFQLVVWSTNVTIAVGSLGGLARGVFPILRSLELKCKGGICALSFPAPPDLSGRISATVC